jgi:hypothetical protein
LGRPDAVAATTAKVRAIAGSDKLGLAWYEQQYGEAARAEAIYRKLADDSRDGQFKAGVLQNLAGLEEQQPRVSFR